MRLFICQFLAVLVLFMIAEGAWDMANESHAHRDNLAHQTDTDNHGSVDPDPLSDGEGNQCGHLCHGHMSGITGGLDEFLVDEPSNFFAFSSSPLTNHSQAPPTPPPNA
jgi:hypothetical protein